MQRLTLTLALCALLPLATSASAQTPAGHDQHAPPSVHGHDAGQMMHAKSIMLGEQTVTGIKAMAHLNEVGAMMAQMGRKENYHFMVMFSDAATGAAVEQGTAAVKITPPKGGQVGTPIQLMGMGNHFGADIALPEHGEYRFQVGTKLADGTTRQFQFTYVVP
ncbi:hypothetical protein [Desulfobulbus sp.]|uniref:hypothetical protein n=1 Tax=Desulfobulbus sp. TaxID=895 RepID=UPI00286EEDB6|nr:hypothetical protein [Desulfobulbus sp.]